MSARFNFENHPGYEKLKEAFSRSNRDFLNSIELVPEEDVYFSPQYEKKMAHLIKRQKRPYWKYVNTVGKRIAVIALAFLMLFGLSMTIKAVREPVISFIENVFEKFSELFVNKSEIKNAPDKIEEVYTLTDLPEGFTETEFEKSKKSVETTWSDGKVEIKLVQWIMSGNLTINNEDADIKKIYIGNVEISYYFSDKIGIENTTLIMRNDEYIFNVDITKHISEDEAISLIKSIEKR